MNNEYSVSMPRPLERVEVMNAFMRSIYNWMTLGLGLTAAISIALTYTPLNAILYTNGGMYLGLGSMIGALILGFVLMGKIDTLAAGTATGLFFGYSALMGIGLSFTLMAYEVGEVAQAFIATTGMFGAMSLYGLYTKKDLTSMGSLLRMGVIGLLIALVANWIMGSSTINLIISGVGVIVFMGLTAYDTQLFRAMGESVPHDDPVAVRRATIIGAFHLYLDFINLFLMLLRLMGGNRD